MGKPKKEAPELDSPEVALAKRNLGLVPNTDPTPGQREALEILNNLPPYAPLPKIRRKMYQRQVFFVLEGEAYHEASQELVAAMNEQEQLEGSRKAVLAEWAGILKRQAEKVKELKNKLTTGEKALVDCEEVQFVDAGIVKIFRLDTQDVIEERPLNDEERQIDLADLDAAPDLTEKDESDEDAAGDEQAATENISVEDDEESKDENDPRGLPPRTMPVGE